MAENSIHQAASVAVSSNAREMPWFDELANGRGQAASLDPVLRDALVVATADSAEASSNQARIAAQAVLEEQRQSAHEATDRVRVEAAATEARATIERAQRRRYVR